MNRSLLLLLALGLTLPAAAHGQDDLPVDTLPNLWRAAVAASDRADWPAANRLFGALEHHFSGEPDYHATGLQRALLPRRAAAFLHTGQPARAAADYASLRALFPTDPELPLWLAQEIPASAAAEDFTAMTHAARALANAPGAGPAAAVGWLWLTSPALAGRDPTSATEAEHRLAHAPPALADLAATAASRRLARTLDTGDATAVAAAVLACPPAATAPDPVALAALLDRAAPLLLAAGEARATLHALALRPSTEALAELRESRLAWLGAPGPAPAGLPLPERILLATRRQLAAPLARHSDPRDEPPAAAASRDLVRAQAWLQLDLPQVAAILFADLAANPSLPANARADAAHRRLVALLAAGDHDAVRPAAQALVRDFPDSPLIPDSLFLAAEALTRLGRTDEARASLDDLIEHHPAHPSRFRWHYRRGRLRLASDPAAARADFLDAAALAPAAGTFAAEARLQAAVAAVAGRDHDLARRELEALLAGLAPGHPVRPDVLHRLATVAYAQDDLPAALANIEVFLDLAPGHAREAEARVLRGDIRLGLGEALAAVADYTLVPPEAGPLHDHALFQTLRVYRALERDDLARRDLRRYLARTDPPPARRAEAAAALAETHRRAGTPGAGLAEAFALLPPILDDPAAAGVPALLDLIARLTRDIPPEERPPELAGGFDQWLDRARLEADPLTTPVRHARLTLARARLAARTDPVTAEILRLELAGLLRPEQAGADALAAVGLQLLELDFPSAHRWLDRLAQEYPRHPEAAVQSFARAHLAETTDPVAARAAYAEFVTRAPRHARAPEALLRLGRLHLEAGDHAAATTAFEDVLRRREARGRPHAEASAGLALAAEVAGDPERALLLHQRVITLHRSHADLAAASCLAVARLLAERGDAADAALAAAESLQDPVLAAATPGQLLPP